MKNYSKINGKNSFIQRSNFNKEFVFIESDFDLLSSKSSNKKHHLVHEQESSIPDQVNNKKVGFSLEKSEVAIASFENEQEDGRDHHSLKQETGEQTHYANLPYQKNNNKGNNYSCVEKKSSTKVIQKAVKKAFSIKRSSEKYCRIHDHPKNMSFDDCNSNYDDDVNKIYDNKDDNFERNGSLDSRYASMMKNNTHHHNHGRSHVGSKFVRACKRLFSR